MADTLVLNTEVAAYGMKFVAQSVAFAKPMYVDVLKTPTAPDVGVTVGVGDLAEATGAAVTTGLAEATPGDADGTGTVPLTTFAAAAGKDCPAPPPPPQAETENNSIKSKRFVAVGI